MLTLTTTLSVLLMILIPVALAIGLRRRTAAPWLLFCAGVLTFAVSQLVHFPLNDWLAEIGLLPQPGVDNRPLWQTALVLGLTAGLCEELARAAGYALLRRARGVYDDRAPAAVMLGLGHGGIESMIFGGVMTAATIGALLPLVGQDLTQIGLLPAQLEAIQVSIQHLLASPWNVFLPLIERLLAIAIHVVLSLIVWQAFRRRQPLYILLAIAYHTAVDMVAVIASTRLTNSLLILGVEALAILPGAAWMLLFLRRQPKTAHQPAQTKEELRIFGVALGKELSQAWRTRRVLIIAAVFGLFGLASPLMAYFMPEMMKAIPGAEQFASLIPPPTLADAIIQYTKNISQFGFLLAILLGIGDIAGEKERGVAGMILSKPMPRWAFVASKYLAQVSLYLMGFLLGGLGGYLYTWILFEPADPLALLSIFAQANGLLFAWLLPYVTITLAASVLANSTSAAAGISVAGAVLLMVAGSFPQIAQLMPGALTGWANALSGSAPPPASYGALAMSLVFAVVGLILGIGVFEKQEL